MKIEDLRLGNLIRISPRPNEEGILFLAEVHPLSIIGVMLMPRQGYHFRIKFDEMLPLLLSEYWLLKFGFTKTDGENIWVEKKHAIYISFTDKAGCKILEKQVPEETIIYAHQLQNLYFFKTGEELSPRF